FKIQAGKMDEFVNAWLSQIYPLRLHHGFNIDGAWIDESGEEFIWIVSYDGPEDFETQDKAYLSAIDRVVLDPDPAQWIVGGEKRMLRAVI
ncbi:MAG: hypothetical protein ACNA8H_15145, partial [Anaerolineales bacterium]